MKRFAMMDETSQVGLTADELESKRKARMERFGAAEVQEAQRSVTDKSGFKLNRRKEKMLSKKGARSIVVNEQKGGKKRGDRGRSFNKGKMQKRFKKSQ